MKTVTSLPAALPASRLRQAFLVAAVLVALSGCSKPTHNLQTSADSTGTIAGQLRGEFVHGFNPFHGSVVYLIPATASTEEWWVRLSRPHYALADPQQDRSIGFADRITSDADGRFQFARARPGDYYLYARVLWTNTVGDSTYFGGDAWVGTAAVAARETAQVILQRPRSVLPQGIVPIRRFPTKQPDLDLPRFGEYVYVEQLPLPIKHVEPEYPPAARRASIDGTVLIQALVGKDGLVKDTRVVKSIPLLDQAAVAAVQQWTFRPAFTKNKSVAVWVAVPVKFTL